MPCCPSCPSGAKRSRRRDVAMSIPATELNSMAQQTVEELAGHGLPYSGSAIRGSNGSATSLLEATVNLQIDDPTAVAPVRIKIV